MTLYLLKYNNYYNRIVKRLSTIDEYLEYQVGEPVVNKNFIPNDYVSASVVVNYWTAEFPDYAIVVDDTDIVSRWFVIDSIKTSANQYKFSLFRDTLADYLDEVMTAPMFIEKAPLSNNDPFIFNTEGMTFNQIKSQELLLMDRTYTPWLVGFIGTSNPDTETAYKFNFERKIKPTYSLTNISEYESITGITAKAYRSIQDWGYQVYGTGGSGGITALDYKWTLSFNSNGALPTSYPNGTTLGFSYQVGDNNSCLNMSDMSKSNYVLTRYIQAIGSYADNSALIADQCGFEGEDLWTKAINENGKIIYASDEGKYYKVVVDSDIVWETNKVVNGTHAWNILTWATTSEVIPDTTLRKYANMDYNNDTFGFLVRYKRASVSIVPYEGVPVDSKEVVISPGRNVLSDAPYCMFAIPYYANRWCTDNGVACKGSLGPEIALDFVNSMSKALTGVGQLIDIQLLPYCPLQELIEGGTGRDAGYINISNLTANADYQYIQVDEEYDSGIMMFWCTKSTFTFDIDTYLDNPFTEFALGDTVIRPGRKYATKLWNETTKYRICAPNFSSAFDFSPAKNGGVSNFNVDCTYKPFQPYIHINPIFSGLYGDDFDDARGLIYTGDCSLTQLQDSWQTYQWQNINYEKTFQRQIENMDIQHKYQALDDKLGAAMGTFMGGIVGANTGGMVAGGHPIGMAVGAAVGTLGSLASGIADVNINAKLRDEAKDYTIDMYNYNLGNIQALPTTVSKVSAFTANNKIFPLIEIYKPTDNEVEAFENKLKYTSCTVMRIGTLQEFTNYKVHDLDYFKGQLIRLDIADDFHIVNTIAGELKKGVFI